MGLHHVCASKKQHTHTTYRLDGVGHASLKQNNKLPSRARTSNVLNVSRYRFPIKIFTLIQMLFSQGEAKILSTLLPRRHLISFLVGRCRELIKKSIHGTLVQSRRRTRNRQDITHPIYFYTSLSFKTTTKIDSNNSAIFYNELSPPTASLAG